MARDPHGRIVRGEVAAFEKLTAALNHAHEAATGLSRHLTSADLSRLTAALRHCIEASTEISTWRSDPRWFALTPAFERLLSGANTLYSQAAARGGSATAPRQWLMLADRFLKLRQASLSLWQEAEKDSVKGRILQ